MAGMFGMAVESLVALLLLVTIAYCILVNRKLEQLRSDESELRRIVRDLNAATGQAQAAMSGLKESAQTAEERLGARIKEADRLTQQFATDLARAESVLSKLALIAAAPRGAPTEAAPPPRPGLRASSVGIGLINARQRGVA